MDSSQNYHRRHHSVFSRLLLGFLPRDTMLARYMLSSRVRLSVHPSLTGIVSKRLDESSWFWHGGFLPPITRCVIRKYTRSPNIWVLPFGTSFQTPDLENFATASRSRCQQHSSLSYRRSSLLTTPVRQSTSRGCLPQVDQL